MTSRRTVDLNSTEATVGCRLETRTYSVVGSTLDDLEYALSVLGPLHGGRRFAARTTWDVTWTSSDVVLVATTMLPRWVECSGAEEATRTSWARFLAALTRHEAEHVRLAQEAASAARRALERAADPEPIVRAYVQREVIFDYATEHGRSEGAWLR